MRVINNGVVFSIVCFGSFVRVVHSSSVRSGHSGRSAGLLLGSTLVSVAAAWGVLGWYIPSAGVPRESAAE